MQSSSFWSSSSSLTCLPWWGSRCRRCCCFQCRGLFVRTVLTHLVFALIDDCGIAQLIKTDPIKIRLLVGCHTWTLPGPGVSSLSESSPSSVLARTRCLGGFKKWWIKKTVPRLGLTGGPSSHLLTPLLGSGPYSARPTSASFLMCTTAKQPRLCSAKFWYFKIHKSIGKSRNKYENIIWLHSYLSLTGWVLAQLPCSWKATWKRRCPDTSTSVSGPANHPHPWQTRSEWKS